MVRPTIGVLLTLLSVAALAGQQDQRSASADLIIVNGKVVTVDARSSIAEASLLFEICSFSASHSIRLFVRSEMFAKWQVVAV